MSKYEKVFDEAMSLKKELERYEKRGEKRINIFRTKEAISIVEEALSSLKEISAGELYVRLMPLGLELDDFYYIINDMKSRGVLVEESNYLTYIEKKKEGE